MGADNPFCSLKSFSTDSLLVKMLTLNGFVGDSSSVCKDTEATSSELFSLDFLIGDSFKVKMCSLIEGVEAVLGLIERSSQLTIWKVMMGFGLCKSCIASLILFSKLLID